MLLLPSAKAMPLAPLIHQCWRSAAAAECQGHAIGSSHPSVLTIRCCTECQGHAIGASHPSVLTIRCCCRVPRPCHWRLSSISADDPLLPPSAKAMPMAPLIHQCWRSVAAAECQGHANGSFHPSVLTIRCCCRVQGHAIGSSHPSVLTIRCCCRVPRPCHWLLSSISADDPLLLPNANAGAAPAHLMVPAPVRLHARPLMQLMLQPLLLVCSGGEGNIEFLLFSAVNEKRRFFTMDCAIGTTDLNSDATEVLKSPSEIE